MSLLLLVGLFFLTIILAYILLKRRYFPINNDLPDTKPQIFFGNLLNSGLLTGKSTFHEVMLDYQRQYGDKFVFWFGSNPCIAFCLPEHAQTIFSNRHTFEQSPSFLPNFDLICPHGIIMLAGAKWKRHIRVMLPALKRVKMLQHFDTIIECADRFIDQCLNDNQVHTDLVLRCQTVTMNIFGLIAFDYDLESSVDSPSKTAFHDFISHVTIVMLISFLPRWFNKLYLRYNWKYQRTHRFIRELMEKVIEQEQNTSKTTEQQLSKSLIASLVSSLNEQANDEQASSGLTRSEIIDEVITSLVAGYENTSAALSWFIFYMSKYPQVQKRIKEELHEHHLLMTRDVQNLPLLTQEKLDSLIYCECVTKEVCLCLVHLSIFYFCPKYRYFVWLL
jgi:cytochrome P450